MHILHELTCRHEPAEKRSVQRITRPWRSIALTLAALTASAVVWGAEPSRPLRIIVPFPPGGGTDILARAMTPGLTESLGHAVVVDNRAGAGGVVGIVASAKAPPDGRHIMLVSGSFTILPSLLKKPPYDPVKDFTPVTLATRQPYVAVVHPSLPVKTIQQLIALAKARPGEMTYASAGSGGAGHLGMEMLKTMTNTQITHIPYKGSGPALVAMLGGHVSLMFASAPSSMNHVRAGRLRALAVTSAEPSAVVPGVPTIAQSGLPGFEATGWYGLLAPAGTSPEQVARLHHAISGVLAGPSVRDRILADGSELLGYGPEEFTQFIRRDIPKWATVIRESGAQAD